MNRIVSTTCAWCLLLLTSSAGAETVSTLRPLLDQALLEGAASGTLDSPELRSFYKANFKTQAPQQIKIRRLDSLTKRPDCYRMEVTTSQDGIVDRNKNEVARKPATLAFRYYIGYCPTGQVLNQKGEDGGSN